MRNPQRIYDSPNRSLMQSLTITRNISYNISNIINDANAVVTQHLKRRYRRIWNVKINYKLLTFINFSIFFWSPRAYQDPPTRILIFKKKILIRTFLLLTCYIFSVFEAKTPILHLFETFLTDFIHLLALSMIALL